MAPVQIFENEKHHNGPSLLHAIRVGREKTAFFSVVVIIKSMGAFLIERRIVRRSRRGIWRLIFLVQVDLERGSLTGRRVKEQVI